MNTKPIETGIDALRAAVDARNKAKNLSWLAKEFGISNEALLGFSLGTTNLAADKLQALTTIIYNGHAEFVPELNKLRPTNRNEPISQGSGPPPLDLSRLPTFKAGAPQAAHRPARPVKPVPKVSRPGWGE
jgi:hypothetical protein